MASLVIYRSVNPMLVFQCAIVLRKSDRLLHILSATTSTASQIIRIIPQLYEYILTNVREPEVKNSSIDGHYAFQILRELREETATMQGSKISPTLLSRCSDHPIANPFSLSHRSSLCPNSHRSSHRQLRRSTAVVTSQQIE